jgi:hypothetical protein
MMVYFVSMVAGLTANVTHGYWWAFTICRSLIVQLMGNTQENE